MNQDTRHLVDTSNMDEKELNRLKSRNYKPVPESLLSKAKQLLGGKKEVIDRNHDINWQPKSTNTSQRKKSRCKR